MKSTEGKGRGRPPGRKNKSAQKNSNASEIENTSTDTPGSQSEAHNERKQEASTPKRKKNPLANLQSNLSPKYIGESTVAPAEQQQQRRTRYRIAKLKDADTDTDASPSYYRNSPGLIGCVRRTTINGHPKTSVSPDSSRRKEPYLSPIHKLLLKNGAQKSMPNLTAPEIFEDQPTSDDVQNAQRNCVVRIEHIHHDELMPTVNIEQVPTADQPANETNGHMIMEQEENSQTEQSTTESIENVNPNDLQEMQNTVQNNEVERQTSQDMSNQGTVNVSECTNNVGQNYTNSDSVSVEIPSNKETTSNSEENDHPSTSEGVSRDKDHDESKFSAEDLPSIKSPSTFSVDSAKGSSLDNDLNWVSIGVGDLYWGQLYNYTYWPCMVCPDPKGQTVIMNEDRYKTLQFMVHVRFFADHGRRNWIRKEKLLPYTGVADYTMKMKEAEDKYGKKSPKYKVFIVSRAKTLLWHHAVLEADTIDCTPMSKRQERFFELVNEFKIHHQPTFERKRQRSPTPASPVDSPVPPNNTEKRMKFNTEETSSRASSATNVSRITDGSETNQMALCLNFAENNVSEDIFHERNYKIFSDAMRSFVFNNTSYDHLEAHFIKNIRSMWALKHIAEQLETQGETENTRRSTSASMKRLSQRIRNISVRKNLPPPLVDHQPQLGTKPSTSRPRKPLARPIEEVIEDIFQLDSKYLFRGVSKDPLCKECLQPGPDVIKCSKNCQDWVHPACSANFLNKNSSASSAVISPQPFLHITGDSSDEPTTTHTQQIVCKKCHSGAQNVCFVCKRNDAALGELARCNHLHCGKSYHTDCLRYWPQAKLTKSAGRLESLRCPAHVCHTCVSDDPKGKFLQIDKSKLTKCIHCPATYHMDSTCIPAGSQFLSATFIICPRHSKQQESLINVNWCFICVSGGNLVCCETCPIAVHAECLGIPIADDRYICEECETGRLPLYGEMVWAKFNNFRWWPSLILPPTEVPENLARKAHNPSEFVIRFFGTNDHAWISRRRVYLYQEDDCSEPPRSTKRGLDNNYTKGVEEAKQIVRIINEKKQVMRANDKKQRISPLPYVKIKSNRAVPPIKLQGNPEKISKCECSKTSENPCGQDSDCLNRVLLTECNPKSCPAGERCQNQLFEKKNYPKLDVQYMNEKGFGLICLEDIAMGTFVIEYVGEVIDHAEFQRRIAQKEQERDENFYFLTVEKDYIIDAGPKGNMARFMNHSCDPNCETQKWSVNGLNRVGLFAIKDIPKNTELTFNYYWDELLGNGKKRCYCGTVKCVGLIGGKPKQPAKQVPQEHKLKKKRVTKLKRNSPKKDKTIKIQMQLAKKKRRPKASTRPDISASTSSVTEEASTTQSTPVDNQATNGEELPTTNHSES